MFGQSRNRFVLCLVTVSAVMLQSLAEKISDFEGGYFKIMKLNRGIYPLDVGIPQTDEGLVTAAYGDFNSDSYTDFIALNNKRDKIQVFLYNVENKVFNSQQTIDVAKGPVLGVICNDFNEDGNVDLLVSTGTPDNVVVTLYFYDANKKTFNQAGNKQVPGTYKSQPVVFQQFNEDNDSLRTFFLLQGQDENNPRQVFYFDSGSNSFKGASFNNFMADTKLSTACMSLDQVKFHQISQKKASSFVDLNSDCRPDLVLESTEGNTSYLEFYLSSDNGFCLVSIQPLTADYHMASFFDVDGDGTNDLVLLQSNLVLHVFYNQFTVTQGSLCAKSDTYKSPFTDFNKPQSSKDHYFFSLPGLPEGYTQVYLADDIGGTGVIRYGDFQLDGKPGIAVTLVNNNGKDRSPQTKFFSADVCSDDEKKLMNIPQSSDNFDFSKCRYFRTADSLLDPIQNLTSYSLSFFDFAELGTFSFMVVQKDSKNTYYISTYYNYLNVDYYFLKASGKTKKKDLGGTCVGCSFQMIKTEVNGDKHPAVQSQQISMSHTRLSLPYIFFGLGRINNYIENFNMGVLKKGSWSFSWSPIIPNSQLFVSPINSDVTKWKIEIFINPTKALALIIISTVVVLLVLGLIILYYHRQEKFKENPSDMVYNFF